MKLRSSISLTLCLLLAMPAIKPMGADQLLFKMAMKAARHEAAQRAVRNMAIKAGGVIASIVINLVAIGFAAQARERGEQQRTTQQQLPRDWQSYNNGLAEQVLLQQEKHRLAQQTFLQAAPVSQEAELFKLVALYNTRKTSSLEAEIDRTLTALTPELDTSIEVLTTSVSALESNLEHPLAPEPVLVEPPSSCDLPAFQNYVAKKAQAAVLLKHERTLQRAYPDWSTTQQREEQGDRMFTWSKDTVDKHMRYAQLAFMVGSSMATNSTISAQDYPAVIAAEQRIAQRLATSTVNTPQAVPVEPRPSFDVMSNELLPSDPGQPRYVYDIQTDRYYTVVNGEKRFLVKARDKGKNIFAQKEDGPLLINETGHRSLHYKVWDLSNENDAREYAVHQALVELRQKHGPLITARHLEPGVYEYTLVSASDSLKADLQAIKLLKDGKTQPPSRKGKEIQRPAPLDLSLVSSRGGGKDPNSDSDSDDELATDKGAQLPATNRKSVVKGLAQAATIYEVGRTISEGIQQDPMAIHKDYEQAYQKSHARHKDNARKKFKNNSPRTCEKLADREATRNAEKSPTVLSCKKDFQEKLADATKKIAQEKKNVPQTGNGTQEYVNDHAFEEHNPLAPNNKDKYLPQEDTKKLFNQTVSEPDKAYTQLPDGGRRTTTTTIYEKSYQDPIGTKQTFKHRVIVNHDRPVRSTQHPLSFDPKAMALIIGPAAVATAASSTTSASSSYTFTMPSSTPLASDMPKLDVKKFLSEHKAQHSNPTFVASIPVASIPVFKVERGSLNFGSSSKASLTIPSMKKN